MGRFSAKTIFVLLALAVASYAFAFLYLPFQTGNPFSAQFAISGVDVPLHFFLGGLALALAPLQLSAGLRRRAPALHRLSGWLYVAAVLIGSVSAFSLALNAQGGVPSRASFILMALLWPCLTVIGIQRAIVGDTAGHRRWMCRSVALTYSAVTLRLVLGIGTGALQLPFIPVYIAAAWSGWTINLAVCELLLRWPAIRSRRSSLRVAGLDTVAS
ncbi:DUF2306 domain-containing protein [Thermomonas sp.]|uniref:DUF2306 domain-containing protein n=1 Tax=Thermomonas sp. TaxID=1971895 RepID=UPI002489646C|nr:DUF2306 domain-containing protein [Thermomonas sp.]MDI1253618.1 DUF2306 domain-containing protein [Thermomonas sp.]